MGYESGLTTFDEIVKAMEEFIHNIPAGSPHLKFIALNGRPTESFLLTLGHKTSLKSTLDSIIEFLNQPALNQTLEPTNSQDDVESSQPPPTRRRRIEFDIDLLNIQRIWNEKIGRAFAAKGLEHQNFPITRSQTEVLPFKFYMNCPGCNKELYVTYSRDNRLNGSVFQNYRFYTFTSHAISCTSNSLNNQVRI